MLYFNATITGKLRAENFRPGPPETPEETNALELRTHYDTRRVEHVRPPETKPPSPPTPKPLSMSEGVQVWLVERTYSDDEQNIIILTYATTDGTQYLRKERALTSFGDTRDTTAAVTADPENLGDVTDPDQQEYYATEATRMADTHDPDDVI